MAFGPVGTTYQEFFGYRRKEQLGNASFIEKIFLHFKVYYIRIPLILPLPHVGKEPLTHAVSIFIILHVAG